MKELERDISMRRLTDTKYDIQKARISADNRLRIFPKELREDITNPLREQEEKLTKLMKARLNAFPIWTEWLYPVKGIGVNLASSLISIISIKFKPVSNEIFKDLTKKFEKYPDLTEIHVTNDSNGGELMSVTREQWMFGLKTEKDMLIPCRRGIGAFPKVSSLWKYAGLSVENGWRPKRVKGKNLGYNSKLRVLCWKIAEQFNKLQTGKYKLEIMLRKRKLYDKLMDYEIVIDLKTGKESYNILDATKCPKYDECVSKLKKAKKPSCKGHIHNMAKSNTVKLFMSHLWEKWRRLEGLPVRPSYAEEYLGHTTFSNPDDYLEEAK